MARREADVLIEEEGRDKGKLFHLVELPASQAEDVALRIFLALAKGGVDIPQEVQDAGFAGLVEWFFSGVGVFMSLGHVPFADAKAIKDEVFTCCVSYVPDRTQPAIRRGAGGIAPLVESDIEEVMTRAQLYKKIIWLETGFFSDAVPSNSATAPGPTANRTLRTRTSPGPLAQ
jgi:hypothetical protein